jgi:hypothetical protein
VQGPAALPVAGVGKGRWQMTPDRGHAQPAQVVSIPAVTTTGVGGGDWMKGHGPCGSRRG